MAAQTAEQLLPIWQYDNVEAEPCFAFRARTNTTYLYNGRTVSGERIDLVRRQA